MSAINVSPGENVTCTFANRKRGQIIVIEDAVPNDAQDFAFTAAGGLTPTSFNLDDDSDGTLSNTQTFANVVPAAGYSVAETVPSGWDLSSATCNDASPVSNINVSAGEIVTCTFTSQKRASVTVLKDATPDDPQDFSFTAGGGLSPDELLAGRRHGRHAVQHARIHERPAGLRLHAGGDRAERLGPDQCHVHRRQPGHQRQPQPG